MRMILFVILILTTSCLKTAEDIAREEKFDEMVIQMADTKKLLTDMTIQNDELKHRIATITGTVEETQHKTSTEAQETKTTIETTLNQLNEQVTAMNTSISSQNNSIQTLQEQMKAQVAFTSILSKKLGLKNSSKKGSSKLQLAFKEFDKKNYKKAKPMLLELLQGKISAANKNKVLYKLGMIEYNSKKHTESLVYFSKIYTKWPKSSLAPGSLYYIARSLQKAGQKEEAKASFDELMSKYPKSAFVKYAKKEIKKL